MNTNNLYNKIALSQNENAYGPSPKAKLAVLETVERMNKYPEYHSKTLQIKLADKLNLNAENVFVSAGLVESTDILIRNFINNDETLIIGEYSFVAYRLLAKVFNKRVRFSKMQAFRIDVNDVLTLCNDKTRMIIIDNPNNPTGTVISEKELIKILNGVPKSTLVVIDEAYIEYVNFKNYPDSLNLQKKYSNLIVMRTFSKIYGLAGLRVGYTIANKELIKKFYNYQAPFSINKLALVAAFHAIDDNNYIKKCHSSNLLCRNKLYHALKDKGVSVAPSESNFLFVHFNTKDLRDSLFNQMQEKNIFVRKTDLFGYDKAFRITIGTKKMNDSVIEYLKEMKLLL